MPSNRKSKKQQQEGSRRGSRRRLPDPPQQDVERGRGLAAREVGSGITKKTIRTFSGPLNAEEAGQLIDVLTRLSAAPSDPFAALEEKAHEVLREAGINDNPTEGGKSPFHSHITKELSKDEHKSEAWYAAAILDQLSYRRWALEVGDYGGAESAACEAVRLHREIMGKVAYEADILRGKAVRDGAHREKPPRRIVALEEYIRFRRREEGFTFGQFKEELENTEDDDPLRWQHHDFWLDDGRVYVQEVINGEEQKLRSISLKSLPRYWNNSKSRAK